jgi:teichoic acid ribitol-phosphate primase
MWQLPSRRGRLRIAGTVGHRPYHRPHPDAAIVKPTVALRATLVRIAFLFGRMLPLRSRVVLATGHSSRISGNLTWIRDGLRRARPDVPVLAYAHHPGGGRRRLPATALHALRAGYLLATSRLVVVDDFFFPMYVIRPRTGTTFVQVWHACGAFKKFGYSVVDKGFGADEAYVRAVAIHSNYDLALVSAARFAPFYAEAFGQPVGLFDASLGIPRTDLFFDDASVARATAAVRRRYSIPEGRRVILYAPTFRGQRITLARDPSELDLAALANVLGEDHVLLLRSHPFVRSRAAADPALKSFVIDVSDWPDINELMLVSDVLVTDYSSAMYEFALLGRPMAFFTPDADDYLAERGFYLDFPADLPGPTFVRSEDLAAYLRAGSFDLDRVRAFAAASFDVADGHATERFVAEVVRPALGLTASD